MLTIAGARRGIVSALEIAASKTQNDRSRLRRNRWLCLCVSVSALSCVALYSTSASAGTPHSQARSCGALGQVACPASTPLITPWTYTPQSAFPPNSPGYFNSIDALNAFLLAWEFAQPAVCSAAYLGLTPSGAPGLQYGITIQQTLVLNYQNIQAPFQTPPCTHTIPFTEYVGQARAISCPTGLTLTYQASPLLGPDCVLPTATPNRLKQIGSCPTCSGVTVKGDPINVSNGNAYQMETDYVGTGANPLKFTRSYNSLSGYLRDFYNASRPLASAIMGEAWSATYFQFLLPLSVTDSTTTYNTVYAYRPDGRVLTFNEYSGVYSPDGDVVDRLVPVTGGGWQYQTADDTIETYDTNGQLLSIATRGEAPLGVSEILCV